MQIKALCDEPDLEEYHPTRSLVGVARHLVSMQNYQLRLNALLMEDLFESEESLAQRVGYASGRASDAAPLAHTSS